MKMNFRKVYSIFLIILTGLAPVQTIHVSSIGVLLDGRVGSEVPNPSVNVGQLQDSAYTYTGADIVVYDYGITIDDYVTVVIIDDGLTEEEWEELEQNSEATVDIIGFLTEESTGLVKYITDSNDPYLDTQRFHGHGFKVISVLATIAREVKVIFVDIQVYTFQVHLIHMDLNLVRIRFGNGLTLIKQHMILILFLGHGRNLMISKVQQLKLILTV